MNIYKVALITVVVAVFSMPSAFASYTCGGPVKGLTISPDGQMFAESIGTLSWPRICNVSKAENDIAPETCRVIYSSLLTAQTTGKDVDFTFNDSGNCTSHTAWGWLTGWYFGPTIK